MCLARERKQHDAAAPPLSLSAKPAPAGPGRAPRGPPGPQARAPCCPRTGSPGAPLSGPNCARSPYNAPGRGKPYGSAQAATGAPATPWRHPAGHTAANRQHAAPARGGPGTPPGRLGHGPSKVGPGRPPPPFIGPVGAALGPLSVAQPPGPCKGHARAAPGAARPCKGTRAGGCAGCRVGAPGHGLPPSPGPRMMVGPASPPAPARSGPGFIANRRAKAAVWLAGRSQLRQASRPIAQSAAVSCGRKRPRQSGASGPQTPRRAEPGFLILIL